MKLLAIQQHRKTVQYALSLLTVGLTALICFVFVDFISYQMVALLLLFVLSLLAMVMDIMPVLLAAILSAFIWDFFFIQPLYTLHIGKATDF